ncbi:MAG: hypothetical protein IKI68_02010 [Clostridia bacterium]|nr:hypothetical protein [Clostridia bacterium]
MSTAYTIQTIIEVLAVGFTIWGLFNEDKFLAFENRLFSNIRRKKLKLAKSNSRAD